MNILAAYYSSWKQYSTCTFDDIDPRNISILYYAFASINSNGSICCNDEYGDITSGGYRKFTDLKRQNPKLKTLLSIGGYEDGSEKYSNLVNSSAARATFIRSAVTYLQKYGFDGIDFDWEYPCLRGGSAADKENFPLFLKEVKQEFKRHGFLLTVAVGLSNIDKSYQVQKISKEVDFINLMTYDIHSYHEGKTGANAPLYSDDNSSVAYYTDLWIKRGAAPNKILLGVGTYGQTYTLRNPNRNTIGAPTSGPGNAGSTLAYTQIREYENGNNGWTKKWNSEQCVPYLFKGDQWIGYDDKRSIYEKVQFAKSRNLAGVMVWTLDMDDPRGTVASKYPITNLIIDILYRKLKLYY